VHYDIEGQYPDYYSAENAVYRLDRGADPQVLDQDGVYAPVALTLNDRDRPDLLLYFSDYGLQWLTNRDEGWTRYMVAAPQGFPTIGGLFPEFGYPADAAIGDDGRPRFVYHAGGAVYFAEFR
jgi:hypothetical protein